MAQEETANSPVGDSNDQTVGGPRSPAAVLERRQRIIDAAVDLFYEKGYLGATTDEIAAAAGVTKRTLYRHMTSKQHLLYEIHERFIAEGLERWRLASSMGVSPEEQLRSLIRAHVQTVVDHRKAIQVFFEEMKHLSEEDRERIMAKRDAYEEILRAVIRKGMSSGDFHKQSIKVTTLAVLGALTQIYRWYRPEGPFTTGELMAFVERSLMEGLRA